MKYIGIDLGTTNSTICSFNGKDVHTYKCPRQSEVTPSAIYIDSRGRRFFGADAYRNAALDPDRAAVGFKRLMGSSTPIRLAAANVTLTPEECSAEILRVLFGYLPEEVRRAADTGTVITVPAAFDQMQKEATLSAADAAAIGQVTLIQEPAAAVMSVMRKRPTDGAFVVYDLGGGTLDISVAQAISGRVSILSNGGIAMCGGRDFDRVLLDDVVKPWLREKFDLPDDLAANHAYRNLLRQVILAAESAKIALSEKSETVLAMPASDLRVRDQAGVEIYLDVPITRKQLDDLISSRVEESIQEVRMTLEKAQLSTDDVERIVFVGGPTLYKPLRDRVARELGISPSIDVNPMTAVAEGAALFAESVDWSTASHGRKKTKATINAAGELGLSFAYAERTSDTKVRVAVKLAVPRDGFEFQFDSPDTGLTSGRVKLADKATIDLPLTNPGENAFKIFVFDSNGLPVRLAEDRIVVVRSAATVDAIASHAIGIEALDKLGGSVAMDFLVHEGDRLPMKGQKVFRAERWLIAGSTDSIRFRIREGAISTPITDNRFIGMLEIRGSDFASGTVPAGAKLVCDYEISAAGCLRLHVTVPDIQSSFRSRNFYSHQEGRIDFSQASDLIAEQSQQVQSRLNEIESLIDDPRLDQANERIQQAESLRSGDSDGHDAKQALERVRQAMELIARTRRDYLKEIRQLDLDKVTDYFEQSVRKHARPTEVSAYESLIITAQRAISDPSGSFEAQLTEMRQRNWAILWRHDWFVIDKYKWLSKSRNRFPDVDEHARLVATGAQALEGNDIDKLRSVVNELYDLRFESADEHELMATANIVRAST